MQVVGVAVQRAAELVLLDADAPDHTGQGAQDRRAETAEVAAVSPAIRIMVSTAPA